MTYRVRDLVETPHLRLEVRAGAGGLDQPVTWAQTSDLEEPWSWLAGSGSRSSAHRLPPS